VGDRALQGQTAAASAYEELFVPALFEEWAPRVAEVARIRPGDRVLDVACGTGVLTRMVAARVAPGGSVTGLDLDPGMLAVAARLSPAVAWRQGTAESLPFRDGAFDAVVSQFGLMFFPDQPAALREMMRVLTPGGRLAVAVWASLADTPAYAAEVELVERMAGVPAAQALRSPFVLGDRARLESLCAAAGIADVRVAFHEGTARFPSVRAMVEADLRGWLPFMGIVLDDARIADILHEAERVLGRYVTPEGTAEFASPAILVSATKPGAP
jgi:SAM-dependent methyltransferase